MKSIIFRSFLTTFLLFLFTLTTANSGICAENVSFPQKEIQIIVPYGPGGLSDISLRMFEKVWETYLGVNIMVVNKPGGGSLVGGAYVASSKPDGYTLGYFPGKASFPEIYLKQSPYQSTQLRPLFQVIFGVPLIAVKANSEWNTLDEFIKYSKKNPGIQYASTGRGATPHLVAEKFAKIAGIKLDEVPYAGDARALTALLGGDTKVAFLNLPAIISQLEAGNVKVLAIHAPKRTSIAPNVPTFIEQGINLPLGMLTYNAVFAPAGISDKAAQYLIDTAQKAASQPKTKTALEKLGTYAKFSSGKEFQDTLNQYKNVIGTLMKDLNLYQK